jgi:hypothetical protein
MKSIVFVIAGLVSSAVLAGPEKIKFPSDYLKGELYQTLDRPDNKQYRELYATPAAIEAVRKGKPIPVGTVLTLVQWSVEQDANGVPQGRRRPLHQEGHHRPHGDGEAGRLGE